MAEKFDAIVVGAGPAGSAAACRMARAGLSVLVLERGKYPGAKNSSGAVLYGKVLDDLIPNFWGEAPVERSIASQHVVVLHDTRSVEIRFNYEKSPRPIALSVLRAKFDQWLADKAKEAGALILCSTLVTDVIKRGGKTVGVTVAKEQGEIHADVVLATDGVNSLIAEKEKLRKPFRPEDLALGVKEVLKLPAKEIEKRFRLSEGEGAAYTFVGEVTGGLQGGGFLHTNRDSLSIGVVVQLASLKQAGVKSFELLDLFKENPNVAPLVAGGTLREYSAHLIPEGAYHMIPRLYTDGLMVGGDAAAFTLNGGFIIRGMDFAIASGMAAADTIIRAKERGDFSASSLSYYRHLLEEGFVLSDLKKFRRLPKFLQTERIYKEYPAWLCAVFQNLFTVDGKPREKASHVLWKEKPANVGCLTGFVDLLKGMRNL